MDLTWNIGPQKMAYIPSQDLGPVTGFRVLGSVL
jgi:hypothetical protein